ncbi:MAG: LD-carboxypeptidase [Bacilli bacterium]|nr:LD-carboxypeptidase [Bacilli bacterium]
MKYPAFIKKNDKIAYVAPSFGCTFDPYLTRMNASIDNLKELGFRIECGPNVDKALVIGRSNTKEACADEINYYFQNQETKALLSVGGGEIMNEILPHINFKILSENPKWFMGYSDNTNLTYLLPTICDVASIYGPNAPSFGIKPYHEYLQDTMGLLTGEKLWINNYSKWEKIDNQKKENPLDPLVLTEDTIMTSFPKDELKFKGRLLGGCLDILVGFVGTEFDKTKEFIEKYQNDGIIWFIEACDLNTMGIRRAFVQLDRAGWFKNAKGFLIGRPLSGLDDYLGLNRFDAVKEAVEKYNVPIIFDVDLGHLPPSMPIITGSLGEVTFKDNHLKIEMKLV